MVIVKWLRKSVLYVHGIDTAIDDGYETKIPPAIGGIFYEFVADRCRIAAHPRTGNSSCDRAAF